MQLALVGSMATDDPEGWEFFQHTFEYADGDDDIKILNNLNNVGAIEVNAFQSQSDVCLQKSIREGFGLTVTEALWKGRPTVAGNVGGIPLQIDDGESGYLVDSAEECAQRCLEILADPELGKRLGRAGKEHARKRVPLAAPAARLGRAAGRARHLSRAAPDGLAQLGDVAQLIVDPVARVAREDQLLEVLGTQAALLGVHGQRPVDRVGLLLDVEGVDRSARSRPAPRGSRCSRRASARRRGC